MPCWGPKTKDNEENGVGEPGGEEAPGGDEGGDDGEGGIEVAPANVKAELKKARRETFHIREAIYGRVAMSIAEDADIFDPNIHVRSFRPVKRAADNDDMLNIVRWQHDMAAWDTGGSLPDVGNSNGIVGSGRTESNDVLPSVTSVMNNHVSVDNLKNGLHEDQSRAFEIVERHLKVHLDGRKPP